MGIPDTITPAEHLKFSAGSLQAGEQPVTFGLANIQSIAAELISKFERQSGVESKTPTADIAFLSGVLYEVWQRGRACGAANEREKLKTL